MNHRRWAALAAIVLALPALAADPPSGTISQASPELSYTFPLAPVANASGLVGLVPGQSPNYTCDAVNPCDEFALTLDLPADYAQRHPFATVKVAAATSDPNFDIDLQISNEQGEVVYLQRDNPPEQPTIRILPQGGTEKFTVQVAHGTPHTGGTVNIVLEPGDEARGGLRGAGALNPFLLALLGFAWLRRKLPGSPDMNRIAYCLILAFSLSTPLHAATPASGKVDDQNPTTTWSGGPYVFPNVTPQTGDPAVCPEYMLTCDEYRFEVNFSSIDPENDTLKIAIGWNNAEADYDPYLYDDVTGELLVNGAGSSNPETMFVPLRADGTFNGKYRVVIAPFLPLGEVYTGEVKLERFEGRAGAVAKAVSIADRVTFDIYNPPKPYTTYTADEPTMGVNRNDNKVYMIYNSKYLETAFDDSTSPAGSAWNDVTGNGAPRIQADPFMGDDEHPLADGTFNPRIWGVGFGLVMSDMLFSDTPAAATWTRSNTAATGLPAGVDNESIASGPYPEGAAFDVLRTVSEAAGARGHAFYYCAHGAVNAFCIRSDNGGLTYNTGRPIFPGASLSCSNHGHVKVGADGTVYVPMNNPCQGGQGVSVSVDAGETWTYIRVPEDSAAGGGRWDSSIGIANDGKTLYYGYGEAGTDDAWIVKGTLDKVADPAAPSGVRPEISWAKAVNISRPAGLRNIVFSTVVAGDPDRAAFAFHGSTTEGDSGQQNFNGVWHLYVALTYDGGENWEIQNVTPGDPTQKGGICDQGIGCPSSPPFRNLLDFMDMVTDRDGRVLVGFADGCIQNCVNANGRPTYSDRGGIARQASGLSLFAAKDSQFSGKTADGFATAAPLVTARALNNAVHLSWPAPADRGSPITGYRILRSSGGVTTALPQLAASRKPYFVDREVQPGLPYAYTVSAVSALGEGRPSAPATASVRPKADADESACVPPGITVMEDALNDPLTTPPETLHPSEDIEFIAIAEPGAMDNKIVFTLKVRELAEPLLPQHRWIVYFTTDADSDEPKNWYVAMSTSDSALPDFEYGRAYTIDAGGTPVGQQEYLGALEPESGFTADGHIALVLNKANIEGGMPAGSFLDLIHAKTRDTTPNPATGNAGLTRDDTANGLYDVVGNESCRGKALPVAAFTASQITGTAPVTVTFDAGPTSVDGGASVQRYVWDFGDGQTVETTDPVVTHRYESDEAYRVKLHVIDSFSQRSNSAKLMVLLGADSGDTGLTGNSYSIFGGALGLGALAMLGLLGALGLRRRR